MGSRSSEGSYHQVQGLVRGLAVLCELNRQRAGTATTVELAELTGLHRSTVKRLLETLRSAGFVHLLEDGNNYCLTFRVRRLSEGFEGAARVVTAAIPVMQALTDKVLWPSDLVTLGDESMVIRHSTHAFSPLSFHPGAVGFEFPVLPTAAGLAWLAFCPKGERESLLARLRERQDQQGDIARDHRLVQRLLQETRERGYGVNDGGWEQQRRFGALAAPIRQRRRVIACVNIVFSRRAAPIATAVRRYGTDLLATAAEIERRCKSGGSRAV